MTNTPLPPSEPLQQLAVTTTPLPFGAVWTGPNGEDRTAPFDGVLIEVGTPERTIVSFFQDVKDTMDLATQIASAAGTATRFDIGEDGKRVPLADRLKALAGNR